MKTRNDRIRTTHVGSLPRPQDLLQLAKAAPVDVNAYEARLREAVQEIVRKQADCGLDVIDDGEFSKSSFVSFINERIGGFEPGDVKLAPFALRDANYFPDYYKKTFLASLGGGAVIRSMY